MIRTLIFCTFLFCSLLTFAQGTGSFIQHKVVEGESLFSISQKYGVTIKTILEYNKDADAGLAIGQMLQIPSDKTAVRPTVTKSEQINHVVEAGETLFSISRKYEVTVDQIKTWNGLSDNALALGQTIVLFAGTPTNETVITPTVATSGELHTVAPKETMFSISRLYNISVSDLMSWNNLQSTELKIGQMLVVKAPGETINPEITIPMVSSPPDTSKVIEGQPKPEDMPVIVTGSSSFPDVTVSDALKGSVAVTESGVAELITGTESNRKFLALHRTVPTGTILKIRNEMNNREVFVRVIGKLPDTGANNNLIIKVSKSAYDRLGAIDARFRVEVTYYK